MSFDSSRFTFDPRNDFLGVVMQQGRVQVDADWNEWLAEFSRRVQAGTLDTFGRAVVPQTTPEGFHITLTTDGSGNVVVNIGQGRMYVDGLLAENHGLPAPLSGGWTPGNAVPPGPPPAGLTWDPALAELFGKNPVPFNSQPYLPGASFPKTGGPFLVYLDVWMREVTFLEHPDLVEKAVGVDTTGRIQIVWQVKYLDLSKTSGVTCATPDGSIPGYAKLLLPPGAQLTTGVVQSSPSGPCCIAPNTGYTGLENQLYRVEVHQGGAIGSGATFKWSRDDASVATGVTSIAQGGTSLVVQSIGRDNVLRFNSGDWIEITDDWLELNGLPGELHQIDTVTDASSTITLLTAVSATSFPVDANGNTTPGRHTRITRWDQRGKIYQSDNVTVWADLNAAGATGDIPVPPAGTTLILENGVTVSFGAAAGGSDYASGQFWTFAARSTDGTVEFLNAAPPRGIAHHYARLSVVTLPAGATDCRTPWPPSASADCCCECTVTVKPEDVENGAALQKILDKYKNQNGRVTICLEAGTYVLTDPLRLGSAHSGINIKACQAGAVTLSAIADKRDQFVDGLIVLDHVADVALSGIHVAIPFAKFGRSSFAGLSAKSLDPGLSTVLEQLVVGIGVHIVNGRLLTIEDCVFTWDSVATEKQTPFGAGILTTGSVVGLTLDRNTFKGHGDFLAGYLQAPSGSFKAAKAGKGDTSSVSALRNEAPRFVSPPAGTIPAILKDIGHFGVADAAPASPRGRAKSKAKTGTGPAAQTIGAPPSKQEFVSGQAIDVSRWLDPATASASQSANGGTALPAVLGGAIRDNTFTGLSIAILVFAACENVDVSDNHVRLCRSGVYLISPLDPVGIAVSADPLVAFGLGIAIGYPLPEGSAATPQVISPAPASIQVHAGGANYTDSTGSVWTPDAKTKAVSISASTVVKPDKAVPIANAKPGAADQVLYQNGRQAPSLTYVFSGLAPGYYTVTLKFAETQYDSAGQRVLEVSINTQPVIRQLDLVTASGARTADDEVFIDIAAVDGTITIEFTGDGKGKDNNAVVSAVAVTPQWGRSSYLYSLSGLNGSNQQNADLLLFSLEISLLAQQAFSTLKTQPMNLRIERNDMERLGSIGVLVVGNDLVQIPTTSALVLSGNRIEVTPAAFFTVTQASTGVQSLSVRRLAASLGQAQGAVSLSAAVVVFLVTRCVVTGNMLANDLSDRGRSLLLVDGPVASPTSTSPPPEICVSANVLQGRMLVSPLRESYLPATVPPPMNRWEFLNTVITT